MPARHGPAGGVTPYAAGPQTTPIYPDIPQGAILTGVETIQTEEGIVKTYTFAVPQPMPPSPGRHGPSGGISPRAAGPQTSILVTLKPPTITPHGAEYTGGATEQYGVMTTEKLPSVIQVSPPQTYLDPFTKSLIRPKTEELVKNIRNPSWWTTDPQTGIDIAKMGEGAPPGKTYAWTVLDVYNIATYATTVVAAGISVKNLIGRIQVAENVAALETSKEQIAKEIFREPPKVLRTEDWVKQTATFFEGMEQPLPTRIEQAPWYVMTRGTPTTPISRTLELAITQGKPLGGLSAIQELIQKPAFVAPYVPTVFAPEVVAERTGMMLLTATLPSWISRLAPSQISRIEPTQITRPRIEQVSAPSLRLPSREDILNVTRVDQSQAVEQLQESLQLQATTTIQALDVPTPTRTRTVLAPPSNIPPPLDFYQRRRKKQKLPMGLGAYTRYRRINPIMEARRTMKVFFG